MEAFLLFLFSYFYIDYDFLFIFLERNHTLQNRGWGTFCHKQYRCPQTQKPLMGCNSANPFFQTLAASLFSGQPHVKWLFSKNVKITLQLHKWHPHFNTNILPFFILKFFSYMHRSNKQNLAQQILYRDEKHQNKIASLLLLWNHTHQP